MNAIKFFLILFLSMYCGLLSAQTNAPAKERELEIDSDSFYYDTITNQAVYMGHVLATDHEKATMTCERLTADIPPNGEHPTNIVAEANVVIDVVDEKGDKSHITADKAVYTYHVVPAITNVVNTLSYVTSAVTNELITLTGGNPGPTYIRSMTNSTLSGWADPIVIHIMGQNYRIETPGRQEQKIIFKSSSKGTNGSLLDVIK